jgi:archaeal flagellin N-terminal-like domain
MRSRRSISDIVAVVLLIVIAIAAAVIIYMWLSGLIGSMHTSTSITQVKLEITGANVTYNTAKSGFNVTAYVYNPPGSPSTSITLGELEFTNGTLICSTNTLQVTPTSTITPSGTAKVIFSCVYSPAVPAGTPVEVILVTPEGVQVTYTATVQTTTTTTT